MDSIPQRLKTARKSKGYTQENLAHAIGMSRGVITNIEYGKTEPTPLVLHALCEELSINEHWLLTGEGTMDDNTDLLKSAKLLAEIYRLASELSAPEQDYILAMIKAFQKLRQTPCHDKDELL